MSTEHLLEEPELSDSLRRLTISPFNSWRYAIVWLILISPLFARIWFLSKIPDIATPFDIAQFCRVEIPSGQNAFDYYRKAVRLYEAVRLENQRINRVWPRQEIETVIAQGWTAATEPVKTWMSENQDAFTEWRLGTECSEALYHNPGEVHFGTLLPVTQSLHTFAMGARCMAAKLESEGNFSEAIKWHIAIFRCSRHSGAHAGSVERLVGCALHETAAEGMVHWAESAEVTIDQLREALQQVREADRMSVVLSNVLKADYLAAMNTFNRSDWPQACSLAKGNWANEPGLTGLKAMYWLLGEPQATQRALRHLLNNHLNAIDNAIPDQKKYVGQGSVLLFVPDPNATTTSAQLSPAKIERAILRSEITQHVTPVGLKQFDVELPRERERQVMLEVDLAAHAYQRVQGKFPENLDSLVPTYFESVPIDPSSTDHLPILYHREDATSAKVWSVGAAGTDAGIQPDLVKKFTDCLHLKIK